MPWNLKKAPGNHIKAYDEGAHDPDWLKALNRWTWKKVKGECRWTTSGPCPRCGHPTELEVEAPVTVRVAFDGEGGRESRIELPCRPPQEVEFRCYCGVEHKAGKTGCGLRIEGMKGP
ncbi:hypothetical protein DKM44_14490 [Deinococcus irradiatisoli]|uniref:Uncharacterized protein n=1 Tax=Deinococcus irradiatisoli TaxID=2202254 RepID=A0A2Z3JGK1_9DEIO|nr:hypothetical protein [Deinococcus irradiatisoli]AWN24287.1 hypothetical protein DKM44_14490 [Deinococcus irradiatisoli]